MSILVLANVYKHQFAIWQIPLKGLYTDLQTFQIYNELNSNAKNSPEKQLLWVSSTQTYAGLYCINTKQ